MALMLLERKRVYDPVLRSIHVWNALVILLLLLSGRVCDALGYTPEAASLWRFHVWVGYALVLGLIARITWGLAGPGHARISALWQPRAWWGAVKSRRLFSEPDVWGHHPPATLVYVLLYLLLIGMAVTGLALAAINQGSGPLYLWLGHDVLLKQTFRLPHEWMEYAVLAFVLAHIAALILHESRHGLPLAQAMVSGFQYRKADKEEANEA